MRKKNREEARETEQQTMVAEAKPIEMLKQDHEKVKELFERFEQTEDEDEQEEIVTQAIKELKIHAAIEEEIFYPKAREEAEGEEEQEDQLDEAIEEHHVVHLLVAELEKMSPEDERYAAKFCVLAETVKHHIEEEENEMLPELEDSEANSDAVGQEMTERKHELMANPDDAKQTEANKKTSGKKKTAHRSSSKRRH
ncbi:MAG TPA: hemerythrin domain-containing protein [Verrucomicrobiae bacterium]|nr:hemerythrin domain-containing protein [Verrucomicrobiae bacterium]